MKRPHLFEIEDQPWCPIYFRDEMTRALTRFWIMDLPSPIKQFLHFTPLYEVAGENLFNILQEFEPGTNFNIVDFCSGSGGPIPQLVKWLQNEKKVEITFSLTDLYPNKSAASSFDNDKCIKYFTDSIDAAKLPDHLASKFRTSFNSFHHLPEFVARDIFCDVIHRKSGIAIVEVINRSWEQCLLFMLLLIPLSLYTLFFQEPEFSWKRIFWSVIIPIIPLLILIDGILSNMRSYEEHDYYRIIKSIPGASEYEWRYTTPEFVKLSENQIFTDLPFGKQIASSISKTTRLRVLTGIPKRKKSSTNIRK